MSDSDPQSSHAETHEDSPPSSPKPCSDFEDQSDGSGSGASRKSPPTSPIRHTRKRTSYAAYKEDPSLPIPRQTLDRWKKKRTEESSSAESSSAASSQENVQESEPNISPTQPEPSEEISRHRLHENVDEEAHVVSSDLQPDSPETHHDQYISDSSFESDGSELNPNESGFSDSSGLSNNGSLDGGEQSDNELELNCGGLLSHNSSRNSDFDGENSDDSDLEFNCGNFEDPFDDSMLYPGSSKTKDEAIYELMKIYCDNKLSQQALKDILKLHVSSLPATNVMPKTVHRLFNYVQNLLPLDDEIEHYYCRPNMHEVISKLHPCDQCESEDIGVFYELPLESQIRFLFEHRGLADVIERYSEQRSQRKDSNLCDVLDGSEYQRVWGDNDDKFKLTLILNTDGVSPHPTSKAKFWPIMFSIMEVPPHLRNSFIIVWGIWFDKKYKPNMNLYFRPFVHSLVKNHENGGVKWKHPVTSEVHVSPIRAPLTVADAPARANVLNMQEHQAKYACNACERKTSKLPKPVVPAGAKPKRRKRRFTFKEDAARLRTHSRMLMCGNIGTDTKPKRGCLGFTILKDIPFIDLSTCVLAEYMHCVISGVTKQICTLWLFEKGPWYIGNHINEMNEFVTKEIHPPSLVSRIPRSFEYFNYLRAHEFRAFLLFYSLVIVSPFQKSEYVQHWICFVKAIYLLLSDSIPENNLVTAETLLRIFVRDLGKLYSDVQYVYNVHQLLHLVLYVRRWGPLWSNSAFGFENINGYLAAMIHGSKNEGKELLNQLSLAHGTQILKNMIDSDIQRAAGGSLVLGKEIKYELSDVQITCLQTLTPNVDSLKYYDRVSIGRETFSSLVYDRNYKRRNSYVQIDSSGRKVYGRISVFCECDDTVYCLVSTFKIVHTKIFFHRASLTRIEHIIPVEYSGKFIVCQLKDIVQKVIQVGDYLCIPPNKFERNL